MGSVFMQDSLQTLTENVNSLHNVNTTYLFLEFTIVGRDSHIDT